MQKREQPSDKDRDRENTHEVKGTRASVVTHAAKQDTHAHARRRALHSRIAILCAAIKRPERRHRPSPGDSPPPPPRPQPRTAVATKVRTSSGTIATASARRPVATSTDPRTLNAPPPPPSGKRLVSATSPPDHDRRPPTRRSFQDHRNATRPVRAFTSTPSDSLVTAKGKKILRSCSRVVGWTCHSMGWQKGTKGGYTGEEVGPG